LNDEDDGIFHCIECHYDICGHVADSETQLKSDNPQRISKDCESGYRLVWTKVLHGYTQFDANTTYKEDKYVCDKCNTLFDVQCIMILIYLTFVPIVLQNIKTNKTLELHCLSRHSMVKTKDMSKQATYPGFELNNSTCNLFRRKNIALKMECIFVTNSVFLWRMQFWICLQCYQDRLPQKADLKKFFNLKLHLLVKVMNLKSFTQRWIWFLLFCESLWLWYVL